jgi:predicted RecA/RadA family phage recombinase
MKTYLHPGDKTEQTAPAGGVTAGLGYVIGANTFLVAEGTAAAAAKFVGLRRGVVRLPKNTSEAISAGARVFWDDSAKTVRNASSAGRFMIGTAEAAQLAADGFVDVLLDGTSVIAI